MIKHRKNKWTSEEELIISNNWRTMTCSQLVKLLPRHTKDAISRKMKRLGILLSEEDISWRKRYARSFVNNDNICRVDQSMQLSDLSNFTLQTLLGSVLGDGCISKQTANLRHFRFYEGHGLKQKDYVYWKADMLSCFKPRIYHRDGAVEVVTKTHPIFDKLRKGFYEPGNKQKTTMPLDLISKLDLFGLMIWYLDDGSIRDGGWSLTIGAKGWKSDCLSSTVDLLNYKFSTSFYVYVCKHRDGENRVVKIPAKDKWVLEKWKRMATEAELPKCLYYKLKLEVDHSCRK